ncbi:ABC transporter ATP-binding protein [Nocardioides limicola]|uniref:ABC transporter ATP-binding protein n=1 Tax=Nocardioides limicola TaxID=2803368 RepID=UPI00193BAB71|nr:ABC transporter ATP-binding protein [Nocardioides sp. DJM-14]
MSELRVTGLYKAFGDTPVLRGVDLSVAQGSLTAVLGPSGCGKTTLLRVIAGFERPDAGSVRLGDVEVCGRGRTVPPEKRRVGVVPQEGSLFPHLSVAENVGFGASRRAPGRATRISTLLELVGLAGFEQRRPHELSGGQQQRVALARALLPGPEVVLLDEPFSALDAGLRHAVRDDVRDALHEVGATALLVTHDQEEALSIADEVAVMRDGLVVQHGTPEQVYLEPADLAVARFVGEAIVLEARGDASMASTALGELKLRGSAERGATGQVMIRPEQVHLVKVGDGIPATVQRAVFHGHDTTVHLSVSPPMVDAVELVCRIQGALPEASEVAIRVDGAVAWFPR